ncbi:MAG: methionine adenosyltransferase [Myxococcota bacterium]|nr:methionine adenosyltransferase [Myxococcota bacterium]
MSQSEIITLLTSESVSEGHPDKVADQISDGVLDHVLAHDPNGRVACETFIGPGYCIIGGEVAADGLTLDDLRRELPAIARQRLRDIGYTDADSGFCVETADIDVRLNLQAPEIGAQVLRADGQIGAGDQGLMFGYATRETPERLPLPIALAHRLLRRHAEVRRSGLLDYLRPDAKSQVTVAYADGKPVGLDTIVLATQHTPDVDLETLRREVITHIIEPCVAGEWSLDGVRLLVNHAGSFVTGGPEADTGLTGRKIIVDTYGGSCPHGGGAFSGKDATKVDRSAAYAARWLAKHVVEAELAERVTVQLSYAIGSLQPVSVSVDTHGTGALADGALAEALPRVFDLSPGGIIEALRLRRPIFSSTSAYGHFGRQGDAFSWEQTPQIEALRSAVGVI